jgi:multiple antibiotic resistance protein
VFDDVITDAVTLFVVIDPIGTIPVFLAITRGLEPAQVRRTALRGILLATGILIAFVVGGQLLLEAMKIPLHSFQVAGGVVLFLFALQMIFSSDHQPKADADPQRDIAVFPLAVPSIAGPGAMLAAVVLTDDDRHNLLEQSMTVVVMLGILALTYGLLLAASGTHRLIGNAGANIISRVMGLVLAAVAVETVLGGLREHFLSGN